MTPAPIDLDKVRELFRPAVGRTVLARTNVVGSVAGEPDKIRVPLYHAPGLLIEDELDRSTYVDRTAEIGRALGLPFVNGLCPVFCELRRVGASRPVPLDRVDVWGGGFEAPAILESLADVYVLTAQPLAT